MAVRGVSDRDRPSMEKRLTRLLGALGASVQAVVERQSSVGNSDRLRRNGFRIRNDFVFRPSRSVAASDRRVPPRGDRPAATRISTSQGCALRLYLMAIAVGQMTTRTGDTVVNTHAIEETRSQMGWTALVASGATRSGSGRSHMSVIDKKVRAIHTALDRLADANLVDLPHRGSSRGMYEEFQLLDEAGPQKIGDTIRYAVPRPGEPHFSLPGSFVRNGWLHVLEDAEISLLMMVECGIGNLHNEASGLVAIPADTRLMCYGIARDSFAAHKQLQRFGVLDVHEVDRHADGRSEDPEKPSLHRLELVREGFDQPALSTVRTALQDALG